MHTQTVNSNPVKENPLLPEEKSIMNDDEIREDNDRTEIEDFVHAKDQSGDNNRGEGSKEQNEESGEDELIEQDFEVDQADNAGTEDEPVEENSGSGVPKMSAE